MFGRNLPVLAVSMVLGLLVCYGVGTAWYMAVYAGTSGQIGLMTVLGWCVFPFVLPDLVKIGLGPGPYQKTVRRSACMRTPDSEMIRKLSAAFRW